MQIIRKILIFLALTSLAFADISTNELLKRIESLENEIYALKGQLKNQSSFSGAMSYSKDNDNGQTYDEFIAEMQQLRPQKLSDLLNPSPREGFLRGNSFYVKAGITHDPFKNDWGWMLGGVLDLKIIDMGAGSLLGEIGLIFSRSKDRLNVVTSDVLGAQLDQELRINTITIDLGFKYRLDQLGEDGSILRRFNPYLRGGFAFQVFISDSDSLIAGQVPQAAELEDLNVPAGQGNIYTALSLGTGFEFMLTKMLFTGIDYGYFNIFAENGDSHQLSLIIGSRF